MLGHGFFNVYRFNKMRRTIIYKVTNGCNLGCGYCYERRRLGEMKLNCSDVMAPLLPYLEQEAEQHSGNRYMICLHGGEPLLMGVDKFDKIASTLEKLNRETDNSFAFSLQTNATLMTEQWASVFARYKDLMGERGIGVSIDGDEETHNRFRKIVGGQGSYHAAIRGIERLREHHVPFGILTVTTQYSLQRADAIFESILNLRPKFWRLLPCYNLDGNGSLTSYALDPLDYASYLKKQFNNWVKSGKMREIIVDPFTSIISVIKGKPVPWCEYRVDKCENFLSVETDGSLCICDTFPEMTYKDQSRLAGCDFHAALIDMPDYYSKLKSDLDMHCANEDCPVKEVCHGGCYGMRWVFKSQNEALYRNYCNAKRSIITHIMNAVRLTEY